MFEQVVAVEASPFSFADLESNLPSPAKVFCQTTEAFLRHRAREIAGADLVVVDPPRAGLGTDTAGLLAKALPKEVRYVSCDPTTLARDLKVLLDSGYRIEEAHLVDMFPQTFHIESFVRLTSRRHE
jgi:23S rRNA (uracil1939-C5)-methyltransferase